MSEPILRVRGLKKHFEMRKGVFRRVGGYVRAVDGVSFDIQQGETFGLVGESGCGKTTIGRTVIRAIAPTEGRIIFSPDGKGPYDLARMTERELKPLRRLMQMIFQDPYSSLSPRMTVRDIISEPMRISRLMGGKELEDLVAELLVQVGLNPRYMQRYPHAFSGGQRQRIGIARALIVNPRFIVADEPLSALDVSVQAQILELLLDLKERYKLAFLFIAHDLSVVEYVSDTIGVMYVGKLVEMTDKDTLFDDPLHPYTCALLAAIPSIDPTDRKETELLTGEVADPSNPPPGCYFHPRCRYAAPRCAEQEPELRDVGSAGSPHLVACHFAGELPLKQEL